MIKISPRTQRLFELLGVLIVLITTMGTMFSWKGEIDVRVTEVESTCSENTKILQQEISDRKDTYLELKVKLSEMDERLTTGQEWIIMYLKGDLDK